MASFLRNVGNAIKKGASDVGHQAVRSAHDTGAILDNKYTKAALAAGLAATGAGVPLSVALMASEGGLASGLKKGGGIKQVGQGALRGAATGAVAGLAGGGAGQAFGGIRNAGSLVKSGVTSMGSKLLPGGGASPSPAPMSEDDFYNSIPGTTGYQAPGVGSSVVNGLKQVGGSFVPRTKDGSVDLGSILKLGVGAGTAYEGYKSQQQADADRKKALLIAQQQYDQGKPLRDAGYARLAAGVPRPDLSAMFNDGNPYKRRLPVVGGMAA